MNISMPLGLSAKSVPTMALSLSVFTHIALLGTEVNPLQDASWLTTNYHSPSIPLAESATIQFEMIASSQAKPKLPVKPKTLSKHNEPSKPKLASKTKQLPKPKRRSKPKTLGNLKKQEMPVVLKEQNKRLPTSIASLNSTLEVAEPISQKTNKPSVSQAAKPQKASPSVAEIEQKSVLKAVPITPVKPRYPRISRRRGEEGHVSVIVELNADGHVRALRVAQSSGYRRLDSAAMDAARHTHFDPAQHNGITVASNFELNYRFKLN